MYQKIVNKQLQCLDGANDSSSSDDEAVPTKYDKKLLYNPLAVYVQNSTKKSLQKNEALYPSSLGEIFIVNIFQ